MANVRYLVKQKTSGDVYVTNLEHMSDPLHYSAYQVEGSHDMRDDLDLGDWDLDPDSPWMGPDDEYHWLLTQGWDGDRMRSLRIDTLGWPQTRLADEINRRTGMRIDRGSMSRYESGAVRLGYPVQKALTDIERELVVQ